ncbi:hypothetical protein ACFOHS_20140 [Jhaorihella thermophila]
MLFKDLDATRSLQGLRLGQGGLILCGNAGVAYQGHEIGLFAIWGIANKRLFKKNDIFDLEFCFRAQTAGHVWIFFLNQ